MSLPQGWKAVSLEEVAEVRLGRQRTPARATGPHMVPYLRAANVTWGGIDVSDVKEMDFTPKEQESYRLRLGDVLLSEASGSASEVGKPAVWRDEVPGACFQNTVIRVRSKGPLPEFLYYHFLNDARSGRFADAGKGVGINHLGAERMSAWPLVLPPLDVQRRIATKLDELLAQSRAAREQLEAVPALVDTFRQSVLAAAFRGDLTADWRKKNPNVEPASKLLERIRVERRKRWEEGGLAKMKAKGKVPNDDKWKGKYVEPEPVDATDLPELPETWCWASLEELMVGDRTSGYGVLKPGPHTPDGVRLLKSGQVRDGFMDLSEDYRISAELSAQFARTVLRGGEVLLNLVGASIGRSAVAPTSVSGSNVSRAIAVLPVRSDLAEWAQWWLMAPFSRRRMLSDSGGSAQPVLNLELVRGLPVPLAGPLERQVVLDDLRQSLDETAPLGLEGVGVSLADLERTLLAKAFRGELGLDGTDAAKSRTS